jgi:hypothetical protein
VGDAAQRVNGGIDLLLEMEDGYVVIDHKTYGNPDAEAVREHAEQYLPQLAAYGAAIDALGDKRVREYWLHFGVGGVACEVLVAKRPSVTYEPAQPHPDTDPDLIDYCNEMAANQNPTRAEWQALMDKWEGRVNIESLLVRGGQRGWIE